MFLITKCLFTRIIEQPFASLVGMVPAHTPRLVVNKTKFRRPSRVASFFGLGMGFEFDSEKNFRDIMCEGLTDDFCVEFIEKLVWSDDFNKLEATPASSSESLNAAP